MAATVYKQAFQIFRKSRFFKYRNPIFGVLVDGAEAEEGHRFLALEQRYSLTTIGPARSRRHVADSGSVVVARKIHTVSLFVGERNRNPDEYRRSNGAVERRGNIWNGERGGRASHEWDGGGPQLILTFAK